MNHNELEVIIRQIPQILQIPEKQHSIFIN